MCKAAASSLTLGLRLRDAGTARASRGCGDPGSPILMPESQLLAPELVALLPGTAVTYPERRAQFATGSHSTADAPPLPKRSGNPGLSRPESTAGSVAGKAHSSMQRCNVWFGKSFPRQSGAVCCLLGAVTWNLPLAPQIPVPRASRHRTNS